MDANQLLQKYCIDETHMPEPRGMNIVQIKYLDSEEYEAREGRRTVKKVRHLLWLAGFDLPLRLNNKRIGILTALFGNETDHWIGKKFGLFVSAEMHYGELETTLMIHIQPIDQSLPAVSQKRFSQLPPAQAAGGPWQGAQPSAVGHASPAPASSMDLKPIGADSAAELCCLLEERSKTWDDLRLFLNANGLGELIAGKLPADCPNAIRPAAQSFLRSLPKSQAKPARDKFLAMWQPPKQEIVDRATGEVINPAAGLPGQPPVQVR
ncbi:MAG TPA: hypothetical protein VK176_12235, partial [Phycisphaerales bacterium]|nr:hypothetical protein [Phycisphaerales bacterium]